MCGEYIFGVCLPLTPGALEIKNTFFFFNYYFAKRPGVTYAMRKSSTPEQDTWLSLLLTLKNKPFRILQTLQREVGHIIL